MKYLDDIPSLLVKCHDQLRKNTSCRPYWFSNILYHVFEKHFIIKIN